MSDNEAANDDLFGDTLPADVAGLDFPATDLLPPLQQTPAIAPDQQQDLNFTQFLAQPAPAIDDLFGDDDAVLDPTQQGYNAAPYMDTKFEAALTEEELERRRALEYNEPAPEELGDISQFLPDGGQLRVADVSLVNYAVPRSTRHQFWHVKLPNFLRIASDAFDILTWDDTEESTANSGLPDENVIRWRWVQGEDGQQVSLSSQKSAAVVLCRIVFTGQTIQCKASKLVRRDQHASSRHRAIRRHSAYRRLGCITNRGGSNRHS